MLRRRIAVLAACMMMVAYAAPAQACGFSESVGIRVTFRSLAESSSIILFGKPVNARKEPDGGSTDFVITKRLKTDPVLGNGAVIRIPHYISLTDPKTKSGILIFGDVTNGKPEFFRGVEGKQSLVDYVQGILAIDAKDRVKVMRYCFDYLEHEESEIATDALTEFLQSADPEIRKAARSLTPDRLRRWLQDGRTAPERLRLYAYLLGNCGTQKDTALLRQLLDRLVKANDSPLIDGILTGYTLLNPQEGWAYTRGLLKGPARSFMVRNGALRAARYFHVTQPEVVTEPEILGAVRQALDQGDLADIAIDYLRNWKCWTLTEPILALYERKGIEALLMRRSIVRYAPQCPDAQAVRFVTDRRRKDAAFVEEQEDWLRPEAAASAEKR